MLKSLVEHHLGKVDRVETFLVDLPFKRLQRFARLDARAQTSLLIRITDQHGAQGIGEAIVPCGPWWSGDSVESMKIIIDTYLAPAMIGCELSRFNAIFDTLARVARGNLLAKAGLEMACLDLIGKSLDVPVHVLLGGKRRESCPIAWPLASGDPAQDRTEIEDMLSTGRASAFKVKAGADDLQSDLRRIADLTAALAGRAPLRIDPNESWSEMHALVALPQLVAMGVELIEQPVPREQMAVMGRITARSSVPIMIDEGVQTDTDMAHCIEAEAAHMVSIKIMKSGGMGAARRVADLAHTAGMPLYMGTFLETGIGTAAGMHLAATLPSLPFGGEIFGPLLMQDDLLRDPMQYKQGAVWLPEGAGLGVQIDDDKLRHYTRV
ncbi:muconate/chloromuconate family cycloisomerase [Litoreibacter roseus]|uniref:Muconate cycloisomerase n=1 Tax=Litoreibacter roseus TaxID=2601869 RepID=A0A6N6JJQ7_9RHOB|nr:muconate/chloromuconate family cycloisomerase [Litoreibacter roseus]GFE66177.1 muconate cycloisomerase [Litoreibacter roseus]